MGYYYLESSAVGRNRDTAVHITILEPGSVYLEKTFSESVPCTVTLEPTLYPEEVPGLVRLDQPLSLKIDNKDINLTEVELWSRCFPEGLIVRIGDKLIIDVVYYRSEKLYFARNVLVKTFRKVGREYGIVSRLKDDGQGCIVSYSRDIYYSQQSEKSIQFRLSEVIDLNGNMMIESDVIVGLSVSYEVDNRLKALRIQILPDEYSSTNFTLLQASMVGRVIKDTRMEIVGWIRSSSEIPHCEMLNEEVSDAVTEGLRDFLQQPLLQDVTIENLTSHQRREYYLAVEKQFPGLSIETLPHSNGNIASIKLHKLTVSEITARAVDGNDVKATNNALNNNNSNNSNNNNKIDPSKQITTSKLSASSSKGKKEGIQENTIPFTRGDVNLKFGKLIPQLDVTFDLYYDKRNNRRIAKNVCAKNEYVEDVASGICGGIVEDIDSNFEYGLIRCFGSDEMLTWDMKRSNEVLKIKPAVGVEVQFKIYRCGGLRCASDVLTLQTGSLRNEITLEGHCTAVVIDNSRVLLLDVTSCPLLCNKYDDIVHKLKILEVALESSGILQKGGKASSVTASATSESGGIGITSSGSHNTNTSVSDDMSHEQSQAQAQARANDDAEKVYAPSLHRNPLSIDSPPSGLSLGQLVSCRVIVDWALQRDPLRVTEVVSMKTDISSLSLGKRKGSISKMKLRAAGSQWGQVIESSVSWGSKKSSKDSSSSSSTSLYFFNWSDPLGSGLEGNLKVGDKVEFIPVSLGGAEVGLAVCIEVMGHRQKQQYDNSNASHTTLKDVQDSGVSTFNLFCDLFKCINSNFLVKS